MYSLHSQIEMVSPLLKKHKGTHWNVHSRIAMTSLMFNMHKGTHWNVQSRIEMSAPIFKNIREPIEIVNMELK